MLAKMTAAAKTAGDATARAAKQGKLNTEIVMLKNKLAKAKHDFGPLVYEAMVASINGPEVDRLFNETRQKVEAIQAEIDAKRAEVEALSHGRHSSGAGEASTGGGAVPPPPGPPPGGPPPSGPPPGWRATKTAEGKVRSLAILNSRVDFIFYSHALCADCCVWAVPCSQEYYYNEQTGETSWAMPIS
jgi:hypothetical protein